MVAPEGDGGEFIVGRKYCKSSLATWVTKGGSERCLRPVLSRVVAASHKDYGAVQRGWSKWRCIRCLSDFRLSMEKNNVNYFHNYLSDTSWNDIYFFAYTGLNKIIIKIFSFL